MKQVLVHKNNVPKSTLYSVVFDTIYVRYIVAFLFAFFVLHPAVPAFASEDVSVEVVVDADVGVAVEEVPSEPAQDAPEEIKTDTSSTDQIQTVQDDDFVTSITDESELVVDEEVSTPPDVSATAEEIEIDQIFIEEMDSSIYDLAQEDSVSSTTGATVTPNPSDSEVLETSPTLGEAVVDNTLEALSQLLATSTGGSTEENSSPVGTDALDATSTETMTSGSTDDFDVPYEEIPEATVNGTTTTQEILSELEEDEDSIEEDANLEIVSDTDQIDDVQTIPDEIIVATVEDTPVESIQSFTNAENRYQFGESECVDVGDGAFYCSKMVDANAQLQDGVYVEKDTDGDREIYLRENGKVTKITDNTLEDGAPFYDKKTGEIVFHRLIEGRYQIIRYSIDSGFEQQLTDSHVNNMEPTQVDGVVVWQRWVVDNWEIALLQDEVIKIITDNNHHDVAPTIRDGYVMWHTTDASGVKLLSVYDIKNGISSTIADSDGGHVENPRYVLVYDTTFENGDSITKEYDPKTGEIKPIGSTSTSFPKEIPPPDATGEIRALVGIKTTTRDDGVEEFDDSDAHTNATSTNVAPVENTQIASTTDAVTIVDLDLAPSSNDVLELTDFDIIVQPYSATSTNQENTTATTSPEIEA